MEFKITKILGIIYIIFTFSIGLLLFLPVAVAEHSDSIEKIRIDGRYSITDKIDQDTRMYKYESEDGFRDLIIILSFIGLAGVVCGAPVIGYFNPKPGINPKRGKIVVRIFRIGAFIGGICGLIGGIFFLGFFNQLNEVNSDIYSLNFLFYLAMTIFGVNIIIGFIASISKIQWPSDESQNSTTTTIAQSNDYNSEITTNSQSSDYGSYDNS